MSKVFEARETYQAGVCHRRAIEVQALEIRKTSEMGETVIGDLSVGEE